MESTESTTLSTSTPPSPTLFSGATAAKNLNSSSIQVSWSQVPSNTAQIKIFNIASDGTLTQVASPQVNQTAFTITGLSSNTQYSFIVRTYDNAGNSDGNQNIVTAFTYAGILGGAASSTSAATISFTAPGLQASGVHVYCKNRSGIDTLVGSTTSGTVSTLTVSSGLLSGVTYTCHAQAISAATGLEDANTTTYSFQMESVGFGQLSGGIVTNAAYQGVILVQALGDSPNAPTPATAPVPLPVASPTPTAGVVSPSPVPTARQVQITWKNFTVTSPLTAQYRLVRVSQGGVLDMNTTTACTSTTTTACQVCVNSYSNQALNTLTSRTCLDTAVATSPARYQYAVSLIVDTVNMIAEELPTTYTSGSISTASVVDAPFRILVPIPPSDMVLVHRDSVNYEMCQMMGLTSDPLNNQRCAYSGLGAIPYGTYANVLSTRLSLIGNMGTSYAGSTNTGTFYDFGYDVFIDRFGGGCNWTPSASGGMCGTNAGSGDCNGQGSPANTIGVNGNVFYDTLGAVCYVKQAGAWVSANTTSLTTASLQAIYTRSPNQIYQKPPLVNVSQNNAWNICQAKVDSNYGQTRLMRRREQVAAAAFQWNPGSPQLLSSSAIGILQNGVNHSITQACNSNTHSNITFPSAFNTASENAGISMGSTSAFVTGSHYTAQCVSRFGAQDLVGNVYSWVSDQLSLCSTTTHTCTGGVSSLDPTNQDLSTFNFDGVLGPGGTSAGQVAPNYTSGWPFSAPVFNANYFSAPLGIPMMTNTGVDAGSLLIGTAINSTLLHGDVVFLNTDNSASSARGVYTGGYWGYSGANGRFAVSFTVAPTTTAPYSAVRCALPAE